MPAVVVCLVLLVVVIAIGVLCLPYLVESDESRIKALTAQTQRDMEQLTRQFRDNR